MAQPDMDIRLQNVVVPSRSFERSVAFYRDALGLEVIQQGAGYCFFKAGAANIAVHPADPENDFAPGGRGIYLDLLVDDLSAVRTALEEAQVPIEKQWKDENRQYLLVADPDGNLLELIEPHGSRGTP